MPIDKARLIRSDYGRWGTIILTIVLSYIAFFALISLSTSGSFQGAQYIAYALIAFFTYWGWRSLNRITPDIFLFLPLAGWLVFFAVKFFLSLLIGMFVGPYKFGCWLGDIIFGKVADSNIGYGHDEDEGGIKGEPDSADDTVIIEEPAVSPDYSPEGGVEVHGSLKHMSKPASSGRSYDSPFFKKPE